MKLFYSNHVTPGELVDLFKGAGSKRNLNANFEFRGNDAVTPIHHVARLGLPSFVLEEIGYALLSSVHTHPLSVLVPCVIFFCL